MRNVVLLLLLAVAFVQHPLRAQDADYGINLGYAGFQGDVGSTTSSLTFDNGVGAAGAFFRYQIDPRLAVQIGGTVLQVTGDDTESDSEGRRVRRSMTFRNTIIEANVNAQYNLLPYIAGNSRYNKTPYVFAGVAALVHNPQGEVFGTWYDLAEIDAEGETYSTTAFAIPYGIGFKYSLGRNLINIGVEMGHRLTFTDYLDDVSDTYRNDLSQLPPDEIVVAAPSIINEFPQAQSLDDIPDELIVEAAQELEGGFRGNPDRNDAYWYFGVTVSKSVRRIFYR